MKRQTFTLNGTTHEILDVITVDVRLASYSPGAEHLWPSCEEIFMGVLDDPPKLVTCVLCLASAP